MENKYKRWYACIVERARDRILEGYSELHHILPRSLGGKDNADNLVSLTAREHFICHVLLTKFTSGLDRSKMVKAVIMMKAADAHQPRYFNGRLYETIRREYSKIKSREQQGESNTFYGKKHSLETRQRMSKRKKELYSNGKHPHIGMKRDDAARENVSRATKGLRHWTNGTVNIKSKDCPGEGWVIGRLENPNFKHSAERKETIKKMYSGGKMNWWNDGKENRRQIDCPGPDWQKGRLSFKKNKISERYCDCCQRTIKGGQQWKLHINSQAHKILGANLVSP